MIPAAGRRALLAAPTLAALLLLPVPARAAAPIDLAGPPDRTVVRGERAQIPLEIAAGQPWLGERRVEIDGVVGRPLPPWPDLALLELGPGLHRVALVGVDRRDGQATRSPTLQIAVLPERDGPLSRRERNGWTAAFAFVIAIGGATAIRRREQGRRAPDRDPGQASAAKERAP